MAIAYFQHTAIGRSTQAQPYTAAAHARYIMRKNAAMRIFSERMPRQWHAIQRFLNQREDSIRKNGRVADKFIIAIPREFTPEQAEHLLRAWANKVGQHRTPWLMAFHWDDHNPHAHCIFIDADIDTGKRVAMTSEKGTTDALKVAWADTVNEQFEELGIEARISFEAKAELQAENDNAEPVPEIVNEALPTPTEALEEQPEELLQEEELAVIEQSGATLADRARLGASAAFELRRIHTIQQERDAIRNRYTQAHDAKERATQQAAQARQQEQQAQAERDTTRETFIAEHHNFLGLKRGFKISAFGKSYTSPARKAADAAEARYQWAKVEAEQAAYAAQEAEKHAARMEETYQQASIEYDKIQGTETELTEAEDIMENTVNEYVGDLSRENILAMGEDGSLSEEQVSVLLEELGYGKDNSIEI